MSKISARARTLCMDLFRGGLTHFTDGTPVLVEGCSKCKKIQAALDAERAEAEVALRERITAAIQTEASFQRDEAGDGAKGQRIQHGGYAGLILDVWAECIRKGEV